MDPDSRQQVALKEGHDAGVHLRELVLAIEIRRIAEQIAQQVVAQGWQWRKHDAVSSVGQRSQVFARSACLRHPQTAALSAAATGPM